MISVDPPLVALFAAIRDNTPEPDPAVLELDIEARRAEARNTFMLLHPGPDPASRTEDVRVDVEGGQILLRVTRPLEGSGPWPVLFFVHGGGWCTGDLDTAEVEFGNVASRLSAAVVSVDYRLAPEHPFPTPINDVIAAYRWVIDGGTDAGFDTTRLVAAGTSAGANLAAALCLAARDQGLPQPAAQMLAVPALDLTLSPSSSPSLGIGNAGAGLTTADVETYAGYYAGDADRTDPLLSPLLHPDLSELAPAVVFTAEYDPIRDDGERYVRALHAAGVPAIGLRVLTHVHGSWIIPVTGTHKVMHDLQISVLERALGGSLFP